MEPLQHESSEGRNVNKDPRSPLWQYVEILGKNSGGGSYKWRCSECNSIRNGSYTRVKAHLTGQIKTGVLVCNGPNGQPRTSLSPAKFKFYASLQDATDRKFSKGKLPVQTSTTKSSLSSTPTLTSDKRPTLGPLEAAFNTQGREVENEHVAHCIYANGLAFNLVCSPYWQQMIKAVNEAPKGYKSPGYEKVRTTLLTSEGKFVDRQLQSICDTWEETRVSIISDGLRDQRNRPLINVIAICPQGAMFLKAIDCSGVEKDATFISIILIDAIESVGSQNVVQVIIDNAKVVETRFASHTLVIKRLLEVRQALQAMVIDPLWESWRTSTSDRGQRIKYIILDDAWWDKVQYLLQFTEPILTMIRAFDTNMPCLGEV
eukprot:PITA_14029